MPKPPKLLDCRRRPSDDDLVALVEAAHDLGVGAVAEADLDRHGLRLPAGLAGLGTSTWYMPLTFCKAMLGISRALAAWPVRIWTLAVMPVRRGRFSAPVTLMGTS